MKRAIPIVALLAILTIFSSYTYGILAENDGNINVGDTPYEDGYEGNAKIQTSSSSILSVLSYVLGAILLIIAVTSLKKSYR